MSMRRHQGDNATGRTPSAAMRAPSANPHTKLPDPGRQEQRSERRDFGEPASVAHAPAVETSSDQRLFHAINHLWRTAPRFSARTPPAAWQVAAPSVLIGTLAGLGVAIPDVAHLLLALLLSLPFLCVVALRIAAMGQMATPAAPRLAPLPGGDGCGEPWPLYSILVPLYDETAVLPRLIKALGALDYPSERLDIILILEAADAATRGAVTAINLPAHFRTVVVPDAAPRTKPKALNYALSVASGDLVVIYDAEDVPDPDQLKRAVAAFRAGPEDLVCLQARLHIDEARQGFLARQFAIEYAALFDGLLPALERLDLPVPLGGTSNHFKAAALREAGAWDPFNVTEDADLGIRLARRGLKVGTLASTTWEEAPPDLPNWLRQRTRWLKGWMVTYLVHTREPRQLGRDLGPRRHWGFHVLMGGMLLSVLAYPVGLALLGLAIHEGRLLAAPESDVERWLWWASAVNLGLGFASAITLGMVAVARRGRGHLARWAVLMPLYWLLISIAGYRALWQLVREPYRWEKTRHGDGEA